MDAEVHYGIGMFDCASKVDIRYVKGPKAGPGTMMEALGEFVDTVWGFDGDVFPCGLFNYLSMLASARKRKLEPQPVLYQCPLFTTLWTLLWPAKAPGTKVSDDYKAAALGLVNSIRKFCSTKVPIFGHFR